MIKLLNGNKRLLFCLAFVVSGMVHMFTGYDASELVEAGLKGTGVEDAGDIEASQKLATSIVPMLFAIWAGGSGLLKVYRQYKAGASVSELGKPVGVVKAAIADGSLESLTRNPTALKLEGVTMLAPPIVVPMLDAKAVEQAEEKKG